MSFGISEGLGRMAARWCFIVGFTLSISGCCKKALGGDTDMCSKMEALDVKAGKEKYSKKKRASCEKSMAEMKSNQPEFYSCMQTCYDKAESKEDVGPCYKDCRVKNAKDDMPEIRSNIKAKYEGLTPSSLRAKAEKNRWKVVNEKTISNGVRLDLLEDSPGASRSSTKAQATLILNKTSSPQEAEALAKSFRKGYEIAAETGGSNNVVIFKVVKKGLGKGSNAKSELLSIVH
jgi:hypothetical protein